MDTLERQSALIKRFFERRSVQLFERARHERAEIAERLAFKGLANSGNFLTEITAAYVARFEEFAKGLIADSFDLLKRSGFKIDAHLSSWITGQIDPLIEIAAKNICDEAGAGGGMAKELGETVKRAMDKSLFNVRRDLTIELEMILLEATTSEYAPSNVFEFADQLVPLEDRRGLTRDFGRYADAEQPVAVAIVDVDHFKQVNDAHASHEIGDQALVSVAETAARCVAQKGRAYRYGGDEFAILLPNHTVHESLAVLERFRREISSVARTSAKLNLTVSIGVAISPEHGSDLDTLKKAADAALYDSKENGRDLVRYFGEVTPRTELRVPDRKPPNSSGISSKDADDIRLQYLRHGVARCPRDKAILNVQDVTSLGDRTKRLLVECRYCGMSGPVG